MTALGVGLMFVSWAAFSLAPNDDLVESIAPKLFALGVFMTAVGTIAWLWREMP